MMKIRVKFKFELYNLKWVRPVINVQPRQFNRNTRTLNSNAFKEVTDNSIGTSFHAIVVVD